MLSRGENLKLAGAPGVEKRAQGAGAFEDAGAGLEEDVGVESVQFVVAQGAEIREAGALADALEVDSLSAPTGEDDIGISVDDLRQRNSALARGAAPAGGEDVLTAAPFDQLADPADGADGRVGPFLEIDARPRGGVGVQQCEVAEELGGERLGGDGAADGAVSAISVIVRWFVTRTLQPARMSCAAMSACTSEKAITRSGRKAATRVASVVEKPPMTGRCGRPCCEANALTATTSSQALRRAQISAASALRQTMRTCGGYVA